MRLSANLTNLLQICGNLALFSQHRINVARAADLRSDLKRIKRDIDSKRINRTVDASSGRPVSADNPIRILAVDDHPVFRRGIAGLIEDQADMTLIGEASNGREAIQQFRAYRPDITLMDLQCQT